ncbi:MAG: hypothetical protein JXR71_09585 [Bacteroidales bacterium]|nr:hypothetical protein [Bacteroidales bacterium]
MWKRISVLTLSLFISVVVFAQNNELEIRLVNNNELDLNPGSTFCVAVMLKNYSSSDKEFHLKIIAPKGWDQLMDYTSELVPASSKQLKIFSFYAPDNALVGDYRIDIEAYDASNNNRINRIRVPIYVKPQYGVLTRLLKAPDYVFSGDTASVQFLLKNSSNVRATLKTTIINNQVSETRNITLSPDSSRTIRIYVNTPKNIINNTNASVRINASILGAPNINSSSTCVYKVIPSDKVKFDAYNRVPVRVSALLATNNPNGKRSYGYMYNVQGGGILNPATKRSLSFHFRGPNRLGNPVLGQTDMYQVKYRTPKSQLWLGDNNFGLSMLTEASRLGRGIKYQHTFKKLRFGTFVNIPRFYPSLKRVISVYGSYFSGEKIELNLGYLNKAFVSNNSAQLATLSGKIKPFSWNNIRFEFATGSAQGKMSKAYSVNYKMKIKSLQLFADYTKADPDFPGYISNTEFVSSGLSFTVFHKLNLSANYYFNHTNMAVDTMYSNAPYSTNLTFSIGYRFSINNSISISASKNTMEDMGTPKQFYYSSKIVQLTLTSRVKRIGIYLYSSIGKTTNYVTPKENELATKTVLNSNLSLNYRINNHINLTSFVSYLGGQQFINSSFKRYLYGGTFNATWGNKLKVSFQYQNNFKAQQLYKNRSILGMNADYRLSKHDQLGAYVNYGLKSNQLTQTQFSASLIFTHSFNFPSSKRKDVGNLHGKILNNGVANIKGVMITMAGNVLYTDENGEFNFRNVKTGIHYMFIDNSRAGLNAISVKPGPYKIDILPGKTVQFEIALTTAAQIKGKVIIKKEENVDPKKYTSVKKHLKRLIVEVNNGKEMFRVYTNPDGTFNFTDLRPGQWNVKVYNQGIPEGYELESGEFKLDLKRDQTKSLTVVIKKIYHKIQFQQPNW